MKQFSNTALRDARTARGLTILKLSLAIGRSPDFVRDLEMGRRAPSSETISRLVRVLGEGIKA